ncbi:formin-like protein 4 [Rhodamnia argentea]|uniref:Formin-like protein n=1 Tax=Rhodamnia argentea TaxID=178133 RepID=A0A8B8PBS3_9MYRT|nr:formin-like protein 4 [Rhodamnia argentea]XP_048136817.1 formin-like protein 4 [Rhodamnia argentea]
MSSLPPSPSADHSIVKAVIGTAVGALVIAAIFFWVFWKFITARRVKRSTTNTSFRHEDVETDKMFGKLGKNVKGLIVDEGGVDVLYLRKLEEGRHMSCFSKTVVNPSYEDEEEEKRVCCRTESLEQSASKWKNVHPIYENCESSYESTFKKPRKLTLKDPAPKPHVLSPQPAIPTPGPSPASVPCMPMQQMTASPPPPPSLLPPPSPPPPPPPISQPLKPLVSPKRKVPSMPAPPPPPQKAAPGVVFSSTKPPPVPRGKGADESKTCDPREESSRGADHGPTKLKPLHWDKVISNADHSVVWDQINDGSLRFDDELIETLFGYTAMNPSSAKNTRNNIQSSSVRPNSASSSRIFIFEPRKSQNNAIVLKSLAVSRQEIVYALLEGHGLNSDVLEKVTKITPTKEEESKILQFSGDPTKLADAECFLYHILRAVPSAFTRFNAMLFRANYDSDVLYLKESLQVLELGCKELRSRGLLLKLLEAVLKAGNRMNAGTARGNAQGFNLNALGKLSDIKSTDGKTTLLHFVVEQVACSEGKRCLINKNHNICKTSSQGSRQFGAGSDDNMADQKECLMLGLGELGNLNAELANVKRAATIEYESLFNMCSSLSSRVAEIRNLVATSDNGERGGYLKEMKEFLEECDQELKVVREEQARVLELLQRTTDYYQVGAYKDKATQPLQLFLLVKDFLEMVDRVKMDITQKIQKKNVARNEGPSPPPSPPPRSPSTFRNLSFHFATFNPMQTSSSESDDDF